MSRSTWRPPVPTGREDQWVEGFPSYVREATFDWVKSVLKGDSARIELDRLLDFQAAMRCNYGFAKNHSLLWFEEFLPWMRDLNDFEFANFLDYLLKVDGPKNPAKFLDSQTLRPLGHPLGRVLDSCGSAWEVDIHFLEPCRLKHRLPEGFREAVGEALKGQDTASQKLKEAWNDAYGVKPRPSVAYSNAVVAVEIAALSCIKVEPKNGTEPTLSSLFSILEAENPKWKLVFRDNEKAPGAKSLATMLRTLWRGHESRHGRSDYTDASIEEARAAVMLAATLVQWFSTGVVQRVEED